MSEHVASDLLRDNRVGCWSMMTTMNALDYLQLIQHAYERRGGLEHQREALKTTSGKRIRSRMVNDLIKGAILPPVVIGVIADENFIDKIPYLSRSDAIHYIRTELLDKISIIDGMQRTTAINDAGAMSPEEFWKHPIRVEFWIAKNTDSLIYRMLVLNTGQVPWSLKRQLQVIYAPLVEEIRRQVRLERLLTLDKGERRNKAGEFRAESLIEAYIAFGLRKTEIDTQETLADEFSRLDMAEAISGHKYNKFFYPILQLMVDFDHAFSIHDTATDPDVVDDVTSEADTVNRRMKRGRNIFDSQPARIGFVVAFAQAVLGRISNDRDEAESEAIMYKIKSEAYQLLNRLVDMTSEEHSDFMAIETLAEKLYSQKRSAVGRHERNFFETAFKTLIEEDFAIPSLEVCWRS